MRGASWLKYQKPITMIAATSAIGSSSAAQLPMHLPGAERGMVDHRVAELLEDGDQRVECVDVVEEAAGDRAFRGRFRPG